jgi:hypothetical protein
MSRDHISTSHQSKERLYFAKPETHSLQLESEQWSGNENIVTVSFQIKEFCVGVGVENEEAVYSFHYRYQDQGALPPGWGHGGIAYRDGHMLELCDKDLE